MSATETDDDLLTSYLAGFNKGREECATRNRKLLAALAPFAEAASRWPDNEPNDHVVCRTRNGGTITLGELRRARDEFRAVPNNARVKT